MCRRGRSRTVRIDREDVGDWCDGLLICCLAVDVPRARCLRPPPVSLGRFGAARTTVGHGEPEEPRKVVSLMKAKLLTDAGEISEGTAVEISSKVGTNDVRSDDDVGGRSTKAAPVYEVTDEEGHAEKVDTRDLKPEL
jgi:hypothetical protein